MSSILWLGIERLCEVFIRFWDRRSEKSGDFSDYMRDERTFREIEDGWRQTYKARVKQIVETKKDTANEAAEELADLMQNFVEMNKVFDTKRKEIVTDTNGLIAFRKREFVIYIFSSFIGVIFAFIDLGLLHALYLDGLLATIEEWTVIQRVLDIVCTALIFAGGPEMIHQVLALLEETKNKIKLG